MTPKQESENLKNFKKLVSDEVSSAMKDFIKEKEPKQRLEKYSERFDNDKSAIGNPKTWGKRMVEEPKQETLEEAVEKYAEIYRCPSTNDNEYCKHDIISAINFGAKWQQEIMYTEEEVIELLQKALTHKDDGEIGSLVTAQGEIRPANFFSWFEKFKKK